MRYWIPPGTTVGSQGPLTETRIEIKRRFLTLTMLDPRTEHGIVFYPQADAEALIELLRASQGKQNAITMVCVQPHWKDGRRWRCASAEHVDLISFRADDETPGGPVTVLSRDEVAAIIKAFDEASAPPAPAKDDPAPAKKRMSLPVVQAAPSETEKKP